MSTEWVDYSEEPIKYQALRPHFFSMGRWLEGSRVGGWQWGGGMGGFCAGGVGGVVGDVFVRGGWVGWWWGWVCGCHGGVMEWVEWWCCGEWLGW